MSQLRRCSFGFRGKPVDGSCLRAVLQILDIRLIPENGFNEGHLARLADLIEMAKPQYMPDGDLVDFDDIVFVHLSVGLALLLEKDIGGQSEKVWGLFDDALSTIKKRSLLGTELVDDGNEFSHHMQKSMDLLEVLIHCKLFHRCSNERRYLKALEHLKEASELATEADSWGFGFDHEYPFPTMGTSDSGAHMIAFLVPEQKAVDAFESLLDDKPEGTDWSELAS